MTSDDDHGDGMISDPQPLRDVDLDALVADGDPDDLAHHIARFVAAVEAAGDGDPPVPSPALARLMAWRPSEVDDTATAPRIPQVIALDAARRGSRSPATRRAAAVALMAKVALGMSVATTAVAGAGAFHVLPGTPGTAVRKAIESVTPIDLGESPEGPDDVGRRATTSGQAGDGPSTTPGGASSGDTAGADSGRGDPSGEGDQRSGGLPGTSKTTASVKTPGSTDDNSQGESPQDDATPPDEPPGATVSPPSTDPRAPSTQPPARP